MRIIRVLKAFPTGLGLLMLTVTLLPVDNWWLGLTVGPWNDPKGDILIVLGADSLADILGGASYWRSVYAARVWREGGFQKMVISGGSAGGHLSLMLATRGGPGKGDAADPIDRESSAVQAVAMLIGWFSRACRFGISITLAMRRH